MQRLRRYIRRDGAGKREAIREGAWPGVMCAIIPS